MEEWNGMNTTKGLRAQCSRKSFAQSPTLWVPGHLYSNNGSGDLWSVLMFAPSIPLGLWCLAYFTDLRVGSRQVNPDKNSSPWQFHNCSKRYGCQGTHYDFENLVEKSQTDDWLHGDESYRELLTLLDNVWNTLEHVWPLWQWTFVTHEPLFFDYDSLVFENDSFILAEKCSYPLVFV